MHGLPSLAPTEFCQLPSRSSRGHGAAPSPAFGLPGRGASCWAEWAISSAMARSALTPYRFQPPGVGQPQVEQDDLDGARLELLLGIAHASHPRHFGGGRAAPEHLAEQMGVAGVVFDQEKPLDGLVAQGLCPSVSPLMSTISPLCSCSTIASGVPSGALGTCLVSARGQGPRGRAHSANRRSHCVLDASVCDSHSEGSKSRAMGSGRARLASS
jgi:hypothetical protein